MNQMRGHIILWSLPEEGTPSPSPSPSPLCNCETVDFIATPWWYRFPSVLVNLANAIATTISALC